MSRNRRLRKKRVIIWNFKTQLWLITPIQQRKSDFQSKIIFQNAIRIFGLLPQFSEENWFLFEHFKSFRIVIFFIHIINNLYTMIEQVIKSLLQDQTYYSCHKL